MNVLLKDADDGNLRLINCRSAYVWSDRNLFVMNNNPTVTEYGYDHIIPLEKVKDELCFVSNDRTIIKPVNEMIRELYTNNKIDLSDFDSYYSGDETYIDLIVGDTSDPTADSPVDSDVDDKNT